MDRIAEIAEAVVDLFDNKEVTPMEAIEALKRVSYAIVAYQCQKQAEQRIKESQN